MPKITEFPGLRTHTRKGKSGQVWTSYFWDGRSRRVKDVPLGTDLEKAIELCRLCELGVMPPPREPKARKPRLAKTSKRRPPMRRAGQRRCFDERLWNGLPAWCKSFYLNAERRAQEANKPFTLTPTDLADVLNRAAGKCEVTGMALDDVATSDRRQPFSPSIDRIDCLRGYERGNIRLVCLLVNFAMNTWGEGPLQTLFEHVCGTRFLITSATANSR